MRSFIDNKKKIIKWYIATTKQINRNIASRQFEFEGIKNTFLYKKLLTSQVCIHVWGIGESWETITRKLMWFVVASPKNIKWKTFSNYSNYIGTAMKIIRFDYVLVMLRIICLLIWMPAKKQSDFWLVECKQSRRGLIETTWWFLIHPTGKWIRAMWFPYIYYMLNVNQ